MDIVVGTLIIFFTSFLWFNEKTFFPVWWRLKGKTGDPGAGNHGMGVLFASALLASIAQATTLAILFSLKGGEISASTGFAIGALVGAGIGAASSLGHRLFGGDGFRVWAIEVGADVLALALAGAAMAALA